MAESRKNTVQFIVTRIWEPDPSLPHVRFRMRAADGNESDHTVSSTTALGRALLERMRTLEEAERAAAVG